MGPKIKKGVAKVKNCQGVWSRHKFQKPRKKSSSMMLKTVLESVEGKLVKNRFEPTRLKKMTALKFASRFTEF